MQEEGRAAEQSLKLVVGNVPFSADAEDLKNLFRNAGRVLTATVPKSQAGKSKGYSTVTMASREEGRNAIERYNGFQWMGRNLVVRETNPVPVHGPSTLPTAEHHTVSFDFARFLLQFAYRSLGCTQFLIQCTSLVDSESRSVAVVIVVSSSKFSLFDSNPSSCEC
ncbi:hypothetical protein BCR33DRAFT_796960 [Rhizoclosmatium globosum]|uniref:RRM domain-containing protein n=1 Tax=Rhizoclosmatium globosum TaxID=329046 RepID=A0A1Y2AK55_9FUNG|nr:hypothetical protein BCR33DRAFT_796960 [Rhizoclosmatium globosum]|eukprot:ORY22680.1 hypothetical protein BCR33DRAFT_796960 [Rhizoclosmatium globosum]